MKKIYLLFCLISLNVFSQIVDVEIDGNFRIQQTSGTAWQYRYRPVGTSTYITSGVIYSTNTVVKLNPFIVYEFSRNVYTSTGQPTTWEVDFLVNDDYIAIPSKIVGYDYDFDGLVAHDGWRGYRLQNTTAITYSAISETTVAGDNVSGDGVYMRWSNNYGVMFVSPKISDLDTDKKFSFYIKSNLTTSSFQIGTISDPYNINTFSPLKTVSLNSVNGFQKVEVFMNNYQGGDFYIAIKGMGTSGQICIDDFAYEQSVNCFDNTNLTASNITQSNALISFDADVIQNNWEIEVKDLSHNITEIIPFNQNPFLLQNLVGNTNYEIRIRANCALDLYSNWSQPLMFSTNCENINSGYSTSFLETPFKDPCWSEIVNNSTIYQAPTGSVASISPRTGSKYLLIHKFSVSTQHLSFYISPYVEDINTDKRIKFFLVAKGFNNYIQNPLVIGTMSDPSDPNSFVQVGEISPLDMNEIGGYHVNDYWKEHFVYFDNYDSSLNHHYIAFKQANEASTFHLDDFVYEDAPNCKEPFNLKIINTDYNNATLSWDNHASQSNTNFEIEFGPIGFSHGNGTIIQASSNPYTLTDLLESQEYDFYIRNICGSQLSEWSDRGTFKTKCLGVTVGFTDDFEVGDFDNETCWSRLTAELRNRYYSPDSQVDFNSSQSHSTSTSIRIYHINSSDPINQKAKKILVSPRLIDFDNQKKISFWSRINLSSASIEVGTLTDPNNYDTFTVYKTISTTITNQWVQNFVDFSNYNGTDKYVGFRITSNNTSTITLYIDDFEYLANDCTRPGSLTAEQINADSVSLNWLTNNDNPINCEIEYGVIGFTPGSGTLITTNSLPLIVNGLSQNTEYQFRVRNICTNSEINWSDFYDFKVSCFTTSPLLEDFDNYVSTNIYNLNNFCWTTNEDWTIGIYQYIQNEYIQNITSEPNSLKLYNNSSQEDTFIVSPFISDFDSNKVLKFWLFGNQGTEVLSVGTIKNPLDLDTYEEFQVINLQNVPQYGKEFFIDFENYLGTNKHFVFKLSRQGNTVLIDDVEFKNKNLCREPINVHFTEITNNSAKIQWEDTQGEQIKIEFGLQGFVPGTGTIIYSNNNEELITGLLASNNYDFYINKICNINTSDIIGPIALSTTCDPFNLPWIEDFNDLSQYGNNVLPDCFKFLNGNFDIKNSPVTLNSTTYYDNDHTLNGFDDSTYMHFYSTFSTQFQSPVFNLIAGTTYKFSLQARKAYQYSPMQILMSVGRGQNIHYMDANLLTVGSMVEYNYSQLDYFFTPLENGIYSFMINPIYSGNVNLIADNFGLDEGYQSVINSYKLFDFDNATYSELILENTQKSFINIINDGISNVLRLAGSNDDSKWSNSQQDIWIKNQNFITKINFQCDASFMNAAQLKFKLRQTFKEDNSESRFRIIVNGFVLGNEILPVTNNNDVYQEYLYDLSVFNGQTINVSLQHLGKDGLGSFGDNAFIDDIEITSLLNSNQFRDESFKIYPNPTNDILNVEADNIEIVSLFNISGQLLFEKRNIFQQTFEVDLSKFEKGVYFVKLQTNSKLQKVIKVIKN